MTTVTWMSYAANFYYDYFSLDHMFLKAQLDWTSGHAMRVNFWTGIEGPPVSSLNCDRSLHSGLKAPELVMNAGCRDNRWTASLCTWSPGCSPLVLPPSQEVGSAWASLSLVGCRYTNKGVFRQTHSPIRASKTYGHNAFQIIHIHTTVINSGRAHTTQHCTHCGRWLWLQSWLMPQSHRL